MASDPTHQEMYQFLALHACGSEDIRFDIEEAIYWFAADWHGGQDSNLYGVLSLSEFKPSPIATRARDFAGILYDMLVEEFGQ